MPDSGLAVAGMCAAAGGLIAWLIGVPVPFLLGGSFGAASAALSGVKSVLPAPLRVFAFFILGIQAGGGVTPAAMRQVAIWPASFAALFVAVCLTIFVTFTYLHKWRKWDRQTAFFAALPGALTFVLAAAHETEADHRAVTVIQTIRLFLIIGLVVPVISLLQGGAVPVAEVPMPDNAAAQFAILLLSGLLGALLGHYSRLPGGMMLGSLLASAVLFGSSVVDVRLPAAIANFGMVILGMVIGGRFSGMGGKEIRELFPAAFFAFLLGTIAAGAVGALLWLTTGISPAKIALAFVPGALEAMTVISFVLGIDPAYVAAHHVMRFMFIALSVPFIARWLARRNGG